MFVIRHTNDGCGEEVDLKLSRRYENERRHGGL